MIEYVLQGFLLGLAYLAPIGMQNMYVINSAIRMTRLRAYQVAGLTFVFDISLALACFFGWRMGPSSTGGAVPGACAIEPLALSRDGGGF